VGDQGGAAGAGRSSLAGADRASTLAGWSAAALVPALAAASARLAGAELRAHETRSAGARQAVSVPRQGRDRPAEAVAGLMASAALFASLVALVYRPLRITPFSIGIALVAAAIGGRHSRLAAFAVVVGTVCFIVGMTIAVLTKNPLY
jgi:hypothetical protein